MLWVRGTRFRFVLLHFDSSQKKLLLESTINFNLETNVWRDMAADILLPNFNYLSIGEYTAIRFYKLYIKLL